VSLDVLLDHPMIHHDVVVQLCQLLRVAALLQTLLVLRLGLYVVVPLSTAACVLPVDLAVVPLTLTPVDCGGCTASSQRLLIASGRTAYYHAWAIFATSATSACCCPFSLADRVAMQDATAQMAMLQFLGLAVAFLETAVPSTIHWRPPD